MPEAQQNITNIPSNRVEFIDSRTGLVSREWYRFFLNLFNLAGAGGNQTSLDDLQVGPPPQPDSGGGGGGGTGTVTSVDVSGGTTGLTTSGGPITSSGTITLGGTLNIANGGTGATTEAGAPFALKGANADITSMTGITGGISTPDYIDFDTAATVTRASGRLWWDNADGIQTLNLGMAGTNATMQVGQESYYRIKASSAITEGQVVMFTGTVGASGALTGAPATGLTAATAQYVMGVATESIAHNGWGYVTEFGLVRSIDTSGGAEAWVDGQILYYNPSVAGGLTKTLPSAPNAKVVVAAVVYAHATNGSLFIRPSFGGELGQYEGNVGFTTLSNGDLMQYNSGSGKWTNVPSSTFGTGSVTSVGTAGTVNGLTLTGGPITTSGTVTLGGTLDLSSPPTIGNTTPNTGKFTTLTATSTSQFGTGSANYQQMVGAATTLAPVLSVAGSDTNVALAIKTQGTGAIDLAAGSRGVNISNGGTVTAITQTAAGGSYTSLPTVAITAPTTAGGVQAVLQPVMAAAGVPTITSGGTGYSVNDAINVVGGTGGAAQYKVLTVSAGVITSISSNYDGAYTVLPTSPASVTGGTGTGATLTFGTFYCRTPNITTAGSGYVEQPTVSFSGGGGSGASAYATVGGGTVVKSLGSTMSFSMPAGGIGFQVYDATGGSGAGGAYWKAAANFSGTQSLLLSTGEGQISSASTNALRFFTNSVAQEQFRVAHTASAVNYVQVTGSATGAGAGSLANITFTGSDASVNAAFVTKGTGYIAFAGSAGTNNQAFRVLTTNAVSTGNLIQVQGSAAGSAPSIQAISGSGGTDTNIDLALTPKGTGVLKTTAVANIGAGTVLAGATNPLIAMTGNTNQYVQSYIVNNNAGTSASSDFVAYANNSTDSHGWADMGFTSSAYADATYTVTGPNEAYLFGSALNSTYTGNLVYATDSTGSANSHQFYVGGFTQAKAAWRMQITSSLLQAKGALQLMGSSSGYVGLQGAAAAGSTTYTLPAADGTTGQALTTNGSGTLSWATPSGSSNITAQGMWENALTISSNYTVASGNSAMSAGPITINSGVTVTVPSGSRWVIV